MRTPAELISRQMFSATGVVIEAAIMTIFFASLISFMMGRNGFPEEARTVVATLWIILCVGFYMAIYRARS